MAFKFSDIVKEGDRRRSKRKINPEPFEIELSEGKVVSVPFPDANTYLSLGQAGEEDTLGQLKAFFRTDPRAFNALIDELEGVPVEAIGVLIEEMWEFWDQDVNEVPGKSKA